jgi:hypothetical protein
MGVKLFKAGDDSVRLSPKSPTFVMNIQDVEPKENMSPADNSNIIFGTSLTHASNPSIGDITQIVNAGENSQKPEVVATSAVDDFQVVHVFDPVTAASELRRASSIVKAVEDAKKQADNDSLKSISSETDSAKNLRQSLGIGSKSQKSISSSAGLSVTSHEDGNLSVSNSSRKAIETPTSTTSSISIVRVTEPEKDRKQPEDQQDISDFLLIGDDETGDHPALRRPAAVTPTKKKSGGLFSKKLFSSGK